MNYEEVKSKVEKFLPNSETGLKIVLAVALSCAYENPVMLWVLIVGVPSSGKTDLVRLIKHYRHNYHLDNLTPNAFLSGERVKPKQQVYDLLNDLNNVCLTIKDWTSIFSMDEKATKKILGDLVNIFDKEFTKFSSQRGRVGYQSVFSQLGCITPQTLNKHTQYMNMVGPRFLFYVLPNTNIEQDDKSFELIFSGQDRSVMEKEAQKTVATYLHQLASEKPKIRALSKSVQKYLRISSEFTAQCRGIAIVQLESYIDNYGKEKKYYEVPDTQIEKPWRAVQQLTMLVQYLSIISNKSEVGTEELKIIKEVVLSSMPADRSKALHNIIKRNGEVTAKELAEASETSTKTSHRMLKELAALGIIEKIGGDGNQPYEHRLTSKFRKFLLLDPAEFLSDKTSETEIPLPFNTPIQEGGVNEPFPY